MSKVISVDRVKETIESFNYDYAVELTIKEQLILHFQALASEQERECQRCKELEELLGEVSVLIKDDICCSCEERICGSESKTENDERCPYEKLIKQAIGKGEGK